MNYFDIPDYKYPNEKAKDALTLNDQQRAAFKDELDNINQLIEENLLVLNDETSPEPLGRGSQELTAKDTLTKDTSNTLAMKHSSTDPQQLYRERMRRLGILKSDRTGRQLKASGEDV